LSSERPFPSARRADVADTYHGVVVHDPYRWLEDPSSAETLTWVDAQNALTAASVAGPTRDRLVAELTSLYDFPRTSVPIERGGRFFFTRNSGLQNQGVLYVQDGIDGEPRVLLDPNRLSPDGTTALTALVPSEDGRLVAYAVSKGGSDLQVIHIRDVDASEDRRDRLDWAKFTTISWLSDGSGFYYTRFPEAGAVAEGDENYFCAVCFHRVGDPQAIDRLVFDMPDRKEVVFDVEVAHGDRWVVITAFEGSSEKSETHVIDRRFEAAGPRPIFSGFTDSSTFVGAAAGRLFFRTDSAAPLGRIVAVDPEAPAQVEEVVAQQPDKLSSALIAGRSLVAVYLHQASDRVRLFGLDGRADGEVALPGLGTVSGIDGQPGHDRVAIGFTSFTHPPSSYVYSLEGRRLSPFATTTSRVNVSDYETSQVWCTSKDGTRVSMFLVHRRDLARDGNRPVVLTGYGGFNISLTPAFDPSHFVLLDRGGVIAVANLRGGGEYGESWHQAGMFERKQNVFDDFIAAAEWLCASGITRPSRLAIEGGSNGGLLTSVVMLQRPDLFGAVLCRVPVADMLRYHLFTVGRFWISEYGSADDPAQFPYLLAYSPYHNVVDGRVYPPILITTADTDDRVSPGMAKKLAARLQQAAPPQGGPALIRVETKAGHGAGKPVGKVIEEDADIFAFLFKYLDVEQPRDEPARR
jgi:prolyl oligopeptidase